MNKILIVSRLILPVKRKLATLAWNFLIEVFSVVIVFSSENIVDGLTATPWDKRNIIKMFAKQGYTENLVLHFK